jgi:hypothetical protein
VNHGTDDYADWRTMRELDACAGLPKGAAFRAFKALLPTFSEGRDFRVLDHQTAQALAARLIAQGRLYRTSVNPVLLAPAAAARVLASITGHGER